MGMSGGDARIRFRLCCTLASPGKCNLLATGHVEPPERSWFKRQVSRGLVEWLRECLDDITSSRDARLGTGSHNRTVDQVAEWREAVAHWGPISASVRSHVRNAAVIFVIALLAPMIMGALRSALGRGALPNQPTVYPTATELDRQLVTFLQRTRTEYKRELSEALKGIEFLEREIDSIKT